MTYWRAIDAAVLRLINQGTEVLDQAKRLFAERVTALGEEGIEYWQAVKDHYEQLTREAAIERLIAAEKVPQKITTIRAALERLKRITNDDD